MADFTVLPVQRGYGEWHFNRFRILFNPPAGATQPMLVGDFVQHFPFHFSSKLAVVAFSGQQFMGKPTLQFHGYDRLFGQDLARPHHDWVYQCWQDPMIGFTAQTLKRDFPDAADDGIAGAGGTAGGYIAGHVLPVIGPYVAPVTGAIGGKLSVEVNRMHFLAGRRSWRISPSETFGYAEGFMVLETIAVERFSAGEYWALNKPTGHLEGMIPPIWATLLMQFVRHWGATVVHHPPPNRPGWGRTGTSDVYQYVNNDFKDQGALTANAEFRNAYPLYQSIIPAGDFT